MLASFFCYTRSMRLEKLLGEAGCGSRNQIKKLLKARQVVVDGQVVIKANAIVDSGLQDILVSGKKIDGGASRYFLMNKPAGVVSAVTDKEHATVLDVLSEVDRGEGLYPIGRLDRDTEGLLLVTNNGPLGFRMLHPKYHVSKTYYVEVNGLLDDDAPEFFAKGVSFHDGTVCQPAQLEVLFRSAEHSTAKIRISEGKFHQVKKMFLAYGVKVTYLKRIAFGGFELEEELPAGGYRTLTEKEVAHLKTYFG